jgi:hypothetical protein
MNFFKTMDEFLFDKIDSLKSSNTFEGIYQFFEDLDERTARILKGIVTILFFLLPFFLSSYFFYENYLLRNKIEKKQLNLYHLSEFILKKKTLGELTRINIKRLDDENILRGYLKDFSLKKSYMPIIESFKKENITDKFKKIDFRLKFSHIDSKILFDLIDFTKNTIGSVVKDISITRKDDLLEGFLDFVSFGL